MRGGLFDAFVPSGRNTALAATARARVATERVLVTRDQRTGLLNERALLAVGRSVLTWAKRHDEPVSIVAIRIAATEHTARCVLTASRVVRTLIDDGDVAARVGEVELAVLLPDADAQRAGEVADEIVHRFAGGADGDAALIATGTATVWPQVPRSIEVLLDAALGAAAGEPAAHDSRRAHRGGRVRAAFATRHFSARAQPREQVDTDGFGASSSARRGPMF